MPFVRDAPASDAKTRFRVAFGSCARVAEDAEQPIWRALRDAEPALFLVSSPLAQRPTTSWRERHPEQRIRQVFAASPNFGLIEFDLRGEPTLTFTVIGVDGRPGFAPLTLKAAELQNGVETWRSKAEPLPLDAPAVPASMPRSAKPPGRRQ